MGSAVPVSQLTTNAPFTRSDAADAMLRRTTLAGAPYVESVRLFAIRTGNLDVRTEP